MTTSDNQDQQASDYAGEPVERNEEDLRQERILRRDASRALKQLTGDRLGDAHIILEKMAMAEAGEYADGESADYAIGFLLYAILSPEHRFGSRLPEGADPGAQRLIVIADLDDLALGIGKKGGGGFRADLVEPKVLYVTGNHASTIIDAALAMYEQPRGDKFSGHVYRGEDAFHQAEAHETGLTMGLHGRRKTFKAEPLSARERELIRAILDGGEKSQVKQEVGGEAPIAS